MDNFIDNLADELLETVKENAKFGECLLKMDVKRLLLNAITIHDEEVRSETRAMLDEDEIYDEGHEDGYIMGWEDAKQEIVDSINEMILKNN